MADNKTATTRTMSPATAGLVGAVVGAAATLAAVALTDRQTREMVGKKMGEVSKKTGSAVSGMRKNIKDFQEDTRHAIDTSMKQIEEDMDARSAKSNQNKKAA